MNFEKDIKDRLKESIHEGLLENFFYNDMRKNKFIEKILEATERHYLSFESMLASVEIPSRNSSDGIVFEKIVSKFCVKLGWTDLLQGNEFTTDRGKRRLKLSIPVDKIKKIETLISDVIKVIKTQKDTKKRESRINIIKSKIVKACLDEKYVKEKKTYSHIFDFCMIAPEWIEPTKTIVIKELKFGGNMDNKKTTEDRRALLRQFALMNILHADEIKAETLTIKCEIGIINELAVNANVRENFTASEIKCGHDFWLSICRHDLFEFVKETTNEYRVKELEDPRTKEFIKDIKNQVRLEFNLNKKPFYSTSDEIERQNEKIKALELMIETQNKINDLLLGTLTKEQLATI